MKALAIGVLLFCAALCVVEASRLTDDGFTVHEWGTFTSVAAENGEPTVWNTLGCSSAS